MTKEEAAEALKRLEAWRDRGLAEWKKYKDEYAQEEPTEDNPEPMNAAVAWFNVGGFWSFLAPVPKGYKVIVEKKPRLFGGFGVNETWDWVHQISPIGKPDVISGLIIEQCDVSKNEASLRVEFDPLNEVTYQEIDAEAAEDEDWEEEEDWDDEDI